MSRFRLLLAVLLLAATSAAAAVALESDTAIVGRALFRRLWVPAPTRTDAADGLGPLFNARSCASCHAGEGPALIRRTASGEEILEGAVFRIAGPDGRTHPWYGRQLQTQAAPGLSPEAEARLVLGSGRRLAARLRVMGPELGDDYRIGPRIAPSLRGRALLSMIDEAAVIARSSTAEQSRLGVSGRVRLVEDAAGSKRIGRYGWKASQPDLNSQVADAFAIDLGLSSPTRPMPYGDCTELQIHCRAMPNGESPRFENRELSGAMIDMVAAYIASLPAPAPAPAPAPRADAAAAALFERIGCAACHAPALPALDGTPVEAFTDLLLHDLGPGLDDGVAETGVRSSEWRTAPLIDLSQRGGRRRYLHDGRAATIAEAVAWHAGEAQSAREAFARLAAAERRRLIAFLEGRR